MKKKTKGKALWILLLVLVILLGVFFFLKQYNAAKEKKQEEEAAAAVIHIYEADSLQKISYEDSEGTQMAFEKTDDTWTYTADKTIPLMESAMSAMENSFCDITATKELEDPDDLSDYGFADPSYQLTLANSDGDETTFLFGSATGENYYFMEKDGTKVYTVASDLTSDLIWDLTSLVQTDSFVSVTANNFVKEVVETANGTVTTFDSENEDQADDVTTVANALAGFYFTECADYHVTDETASQYGLDAASRTKVTLTYNETNDDGDAEEKVVVFYVGTKDSTSTYYYVQMDGSQMVNEVLVTSVQNALGLGLSASETTE